jgi:hypothetical protein
MKEFNNKLVQEQFDKMNQLDRIEFRQKRDYLSSQSIDTGAVKFLLYMCAIIGFVFLTALGAYNINPESASVIASLIPSLFKVGLLIFIFLIVLQLLFKLIDLRKRKELFEEYFKIKYIGRKK